MFGEEAGVPLIYLLSAASPTDPSRKSLVEYLTTGDWPALSSSGMASWTGILEKIGGDYEDVRDEVFQDEPMSVEPETSTLTMRESNQSGREGSGEAAQIGSTTSLRTRNRSRGSLLSLGGGGGGKRQRGGRGGRGAAGGRTSSLGRGRRGLLASPAARRSRENLYEAPPSAAKSEGRAEAIEESSQSPVRAAAPARSLFGRGSASPAARRRRGSRSRASSQDRRRESLGSIRAEIAGSASRASGAGSQVDVGVSQPDLRGSRMSLRGRQRRGLFQGRSASRERAGSVESVGRGRGGGGGERRGGLLGGRSRSRGRLVQSRAELSQGTDGEVGESRPVGGGVGQEGGRRGRARAKSQQHLGERGEEAGERQGRRGAGSLPRKREPIRRSQSTWSVR